MATVIGGGSARANIASIRPDRMERVLAAASVVLFAAALTAIIKGRAHWAEVPALIWLHLASILVATALTPVILLGKRGTLRHRVLGRVWAIAMLSTAIVSLFIHVSGPGRFSLIHILSVWTLIQVPIIWWSARTHNIAKHRGSVRGMVIGALLIAGSFTFPFHRLLGRWLFG